MCSRASSCEKPSVVSVGTLNPVQPEELHRCHVLGIAELQGRERVKRAREQMMGSTSVGLRNCCASSRLSRTKRNSRCIIIVEGGRKAERPWEPLSKKLPRSFIVAWPFMLLVWTADPEGDTCGRR